MDTFNFSFFDDDQKAPTEEDPTKPAPKPVLGFADDDETPTAASEFDASNFALDLPATEVLTDSPNTDPLYSGFDAPASEAENAPAMDFATPTPSEEFSMEETDPLDWSAGEVVAEEHDPLGMDFSLDAPPIEAISDQSAQNAADVPEIGFSFPEAKISAPESDFSAPEMSFANAESAPTIENVAPESDFNFDAPAEDAPESETPEALETVDFLETPDISEVTDLDAPNIADEIPYDAAIEAVVARRDPFEDYTPPPPPLKVAVLGASGIGKSHARWFARHGCEVVGFLGSTNTSVVATEESLRALFEFDGQGFDKLDQLLDETQPEAVCIATPPQLHFAHVQACLERGIHVLCEKPLVYAPGRPARETLNAARDLVKLAAKNKLIFATQLQYGGATPILCKLAGTTFYDVGDFSMEMETANPKAPRDPKELWIDLAPHPISIAQFLGGEGAKLLEDSIQVVPQVSENSTALSARFGIQCADGRLLVARAILRTLDRHRENREPRRRFSFNGRVVQYRRTRDHRAQYTAPDDYDSLYDDPVDYLIGNFIRACRGKEEILISGEFGRQNLEWLLKIGASL